MAIAAIEAQLRHMDTVGKGHRLDRLIADPRVFGREIIGDCPGHSGSRQQRANNNIARQPVGPLWKNIRHLSLFLCY